jgi:hypothetical protein
MYVVARSAVAYTICFAAVLPARLNAQTPTAAELSRFVTARENVARISSTIWPRFRTDTIPLQLVLPGRGTVLIGWNGEAPAGYAPLKQRGILWLGQADRGAASTATALGDRDVAQVVVNDASPRALAGLIAHESFHVFERSVRTKGIRFGQGENSYYVSQYPVFDVNNETRFALELEALRDGLTAGTTAATRTAAAQFLAVREARQKAMNPDVAEFEAMSEMNEGLAEYALLRGSTSSPAEARRTAAERARTLLSNTDLSVRLRFYVTGSSQALLLDRIGPADWKAQLMRRDATLQQMLREAVGGVAVAPDAERGHDVDALRNAAQQRVAALRASIRSRADSLLARPGVKLTLDGSGTGLSSCGFDPQNMLQLGDGDILHTRWLKVCQHGMDLEFNTAIVQRRTSITAVIGSAADVVITAAGSPVTPTDTDVAYDDVRITSPGVTGTIKRARIRSSAGSLTVTPLEPPGDPGH